MVIDTTGVSGRAFDATATDRGAARATTRAVDDTTAGRTEASKRWSAWRSTAVDVIAETDERLAAWYDRATAGELLSRMHALHAARVAARADAADATDVADHMVSHWGQRALKGREQATQTGRIVADALADGWHHADERDEPLPVAWSLSLTGKVRFTTDDDMSGTVADDVRYWDTITDDDGHAARVPSAPRRTETRLATVYATAYGTDQADVYGVTYYVVTDWQRDERADGGVFCNPSRIDTATRTALCTDLENKLVRGTLPVLPTTDDTTERTPRYFQTVPVQRADTATLHGPEVATGHVSAAGRTFSSVSIHHADERHNAVKGTTGGRKGGGRSYTLDTTHFAPITVKRANAADGLADAIAKQRTVTIDPTPIDTNERAEQVRELRNVFGFAECRGPACAHAADALATRSPVAARMSLSRCGRGDHADAMADGDQTVPVATVTARMIARRDDAECMAIARAIDNATPRAASTGRARPLAKLVIAEGFATRRAALRARIAEREANGAPCPRTRAALAS